MELKEKIEKKQIQVEKLEKKIEKLESNNNKEGFIKCEAGYYSKSPKSVKTMEDLINAKLEWSNGTWTKEEVIIDLINAFESYQNNMEKEIRCSKRDLEEAKILLAKYQNQLKEQQEFKEEVKIDIIWNFLLNWKEQVKNFVRKDVENIEKYNQARRKENRDYAEIIRLKNIPNALTWLVYNHGNVDEEKLEKILQKDVETKYKELIHRVEEITGTITDAKYLTIGGKGDINGYIIGEQGKARVETIGAGGYNIQCYHFRTLIKGMR